MTQVAGIQAVNAEGNVIGTLSVDDLTELVSAKIIQEAKNEAVPARSASVMSEASTLAATDEYEDQLALDTNPAYIRSLDTNGNPKRTAIASLASVVGGLIPEATKTNKGLMTPYLAGLTVTHSVTVKSGDFVKLFTVRQFGIGTFQLFSGDFVANNPSTLYNAFITVNNRSQGNLNLVVMGVKATSATIYAKWNSDNSIDVYVKMPNAAYVICNLSWILQSTSYHFTTKMEIVNSVSETELTKYQL